MGSPSNPSVRIYPNTLEPRMHTRSASARIRGKWICKYLRKVGWNCKIGTWEMPGTADVSIFQKVYENPRVHVMARQLIDAGKAVVLDLCDADWLTPQKHANLVKMLPLCSAAVGSTPIVTAWLGRYVPSFTVSDGVDMDAHQETKKHRQANPLKVVWFGNKSNYGLIKDKLHQVWSLGHRMVTISDHPEATWPWSLSTINNNLLNCDIFWDPRGHGYEYECKTNNKELKAWALGLPVVHGDSAACVTRFESAKERTKEARYRLKVIERFWSMDVVIRQWESVIRAIWAMVRRNSDS